MKPKQISIWNGIVMGGGVGVSIHAPIRVATDTTVYAVPETGIGFFTDVGGSYFLSRVNNNISLGLYLGITGHRVKSRDLVKWGIATHFVAKDNLPKLYQDLVSNVHKTTSDSDILSIVDSHSD
jgi:3-hydroxyisobutyryl-CoA hydrolase